MCALASLLSSYVRVMHSAVSASPLLGRGREEASNSSFRLSSGRGAMQVARCLQAPLLGRGGGEASPCLVFAISSGSGLAVRAMSASPSPRADAEGASVATTEALASQRSLLQQSCGGEASLSPCFR